MKIPNQGKVDTSTIRDVLGRASSTRVSQSFPNSKAKSLNNAQPSNFTLETKSNFFKAYPPRLPPFSEILTHTQTIQQKITPVNFPYPIQFSRIMREVHEKEKAKQNQAPPSD